MHGLQGHSIITLNRTPLTLKHFSGNLTTPHPHHPTHRNANNVKQYTFITLFIIGMGHIKETLANWTRLSAILVFTEVTTRHWRQERCATLSPTYTNVVMSLSIATVAMIQITSKHVTIAVTRTLLLSHHIYITMHGVTICQWHQQLKWHQICLITDHYKHSQNHPPLTASCQ